MMKNIKKEKYMRVTVELMNLNLIVNIFSYDIFINSKYNRLYNFKRPKLN